MNSNRKPILVTGSHRSGSTWVGKTLAKSPNTIYISEPFSLSKYNSVNILGSKMPNWFQFINYENSKLHLNSVDRCFSLKYPFFENLNSVTQPKEGAKLFRDYSRFFFHRIRRSTPIIKDPMAFFSAPWLSKNYELNVVVMIRHPAAFCSSLKLKSWHFDFKNFVEQPLLMANRLTQYEYEIREFAQSKPNIIDQGILLWNCIHRTILDYKNEHPKWLFIKHEQVSQNPVSEFKKIFNRFDLFFSENTFKYISQSTGTHNPIEQYKGKELSRNSKANIQNWKKRLTQEEIFRIKKGTKKIWESFYDNSDW